MVTGGWIDALPIGRRAPILPTRMSPQLRLLRFERVVAILAMRSVPI